VRALLELGGGRWFKDYQALQTANTKSRLGLIIGDKFAYHDLGDGSGLCYVSTAWVFKCVSAFEVLPLDSPC
jgi:hypothetical protein